MIKSVILLSPNAPTKEPSNFSSGFTGGAVTCSVFVFVSAATVAVFSFFLSLLQEKRNAAVQKQRRNFLMAEGLNLFN
jgi:hypothetical protein